MLPRPPRGRDAFALVLLVLALVQLACDEPSSSLGPQRLAAAPQVARAEVGFVDIEAATYRIGQTEFRSSPTRLFYDFQPAREPGPQSPLFVLTGGGPAASALFLLAFHATNSLGPPNATLSRSDWALTQLGHVFTAEARNAGFSYGLLEDPSQPSLREQEFRVANYNVHRDAADVWELLLDFLDHHPWLASHPIYFVTESYGAVRVSVMVHWVLNAAEYASGAREFWMPELFERLAELEAPKGQILLEPWFAGTRQAEVTGALLEQPGSVLEELATESGESYVRCGDQTSDCDPYLNARAFLDRVDRSAYDIRAGSDWSKRHNDLIAEAVTHRETLAGIAGVELATLDSVLGQGREDAYRFANSGLGLSVQRGELEQAYGELPPWDAHFVPLNREARDIFLSDDAEDVNTSPNQEHWVRLLLENLRTIPTFVSRAKFDLVVYAPALIPVLESYPEVSRASLLEGPDGNQVRVEFSDGTRRTISSPAYASSHSVSRDQPAELELDIAGFVAQNP